MANCTLANGIPLECLDSTGGIKNVYIGAFSDATTFTYDTDESIDAITSSETFYQFKFRPQTASFTEELTKSLENGTTFYTQTLNLTLTFLDKATQEELKLLAHARPHVAVEDYNGNFFLVGLEHGAEVTGGTVVTGAAMGDLSGFTLTFEGQETAPAYFVTSTVITDDASAVQIDPTA